MEILCKFKEDTSCINMKFTYSQQKKSNALFITHLIISNFKKAYFGILSDFNVRLFLHGGVTIFDHFNVLSLRYIPPVSPFSYEVQEINACVYHRATKCARYASTYTLSMSKHKVCTHIITSRQDGLLAWEARNNHATHLTRSWLRYKREVTTMALRYCEKRIK